MSAPEPRPRRRWLWRSLAFLLLLGVIFVLGSINVPFLRPNEPSEVILLYVFSGVVFLAFVIYGLVLTRYLVRLYTEHRRQVLGAKFKTKMVAAALALSLLPVIALFFLSYALVNRTLAKWFPRPLEIVRDDAVFIVQRLLNEHEDLTRDLAWQLARDPGLAGALVAGDIAPLERSLTALAETRDLQWAAVLDAKDRVLADYRRPGTRGDFRGEVSKLVEPRAAVAYTLSDEVEGARYSFARVRVESAAGTPVGAVLVAQLLPRDLILRANEIERESAAYDAITRDRSLYRWQALLFLGLITVLLLLAATWSALYLSKQVTIPIQALAGATEEVSRGNLDYRVDVPAQDELGTLVNSFNQMTAQLREGRQNLEQAMSELDQRRQWTEVILENVPAGVITLDADLRVLSANAAAQHLLGRPLQAGAGLQDALGAEADPVWDELSARAKQIGFASRQVDFRLGSRIAHIAVSMSALRHGQESEGPQRAGAGYVLVLDDLTDLLKAEKAAAWQEVAQRMAHEIKNPLTPIQLSADRIQRYLERERQAAPGQQGQTHDLMAQCAALIAQEVHGLKALVDEFSRFARFPSAQPVPTQLNQLVESTLALYGDTVDGIRLAAQLDPALPAITADPALLRRALVNLIDNAKEAVSGAATKDILVRTRYLPTVSAVELSVSDSGPGISPENKERLFLPFFSTKPSGMGLGLAIVSRIVADHHGHVRVEDNSPSGTRFVVELPTVVPVAA